MASNALEKQSIEEKASFEHNDSKEGSSHEQERSLSYGSDDGASKPKLPYGWQFAMIILTCLCTCKLSFIRTCRVCIETKVSLLSRKSLVECELLLRGFLTNEFSLAAIGPDRVSTNVRAYQCFPLTKRE